MKRLLAICLMPLAAASMLALSGSMMAQDVESAATASAAGPGVDPALERGRYLVEGVGMCGQCHTGRSATGELSRSRALHGGPVPVSKPMAWSEPWAYKAPRIAGLPQHTDEEFITLMTTGVNRDGRTLMLPMPPFRLTEEDAKAIAVYLRSLP